MLFEKTREIFELIEFLKRSSAPAHDFANGLLHDGLIFRVHSRTQCKSTSERNKGNNDLHSLPDLFASRG